MTETFAFPKSYVHPRTKRLSVKFWLNSKGAPRRRMREAVDKHGDDFAWAYTPHKVRINRLMLSEEVASGRTGWDEAMTWMEENVRAPWFLWMKREDLGDGQRELVEYIGFADPVDAVAFAVWLKR